MRHLRLAALLLLFSGSAWADEEGEEVEEEAEATLTWKVFEEQRRGECLGPPGVLEEPISFKAGRHRFRLEGHRLVQLNKDRDRVLRIGVISATKDERDETMSQVEDMIARLKKLKMDVLIANGDLGSHEINLEERIFPVLANSGVLVIAHTGNTESCGAFNISADKVFQKQRNFINGNWVRRFDLDDGTILTLPGYYDRRFVHTGGAAKYDEEDLRHLKRMFNDAKKPKILVSHGPPKMRGRYGIDIATDAGHVGDQDMTDLLKRTKVKFGIFGHILEAGGRASDLTGRKKRKKKKWYKSLFVNAGTANPDPWGLLNGKTSYGMALFVEVKGRKARYRVLKPKR